jgi:hypothetical protein
MAAPHQNPLQPEGQAIGYTPVLLRTSEDARRYLSGRGLPDIGPARILDFSRQAEMLGSYLGERGASVLGRVRPLAIEVGPEALERYISLSGQSGAQIYGPHPNALYIPGTNLILVSSAASMGSDYLPLHEMAHLVSHVNRRGRGMGQEHAAPGTVVMQPAMIEEGFADLIASRAGRSGAAGLSYPFEALLVVALEGVVGNRVLMDAFESGDYRPLVAEIDRRLGQRTFESMLAQGTGLEALRYLIRRDSGTPPVIPRERLHQTPIWRAVMGDGTAEDLLRPVVPSAGSSN